MTKANDIEIQFHRLILMGLHETWLILWTAEYGI
ncbi:hypothetical protein LCGC14_1582180 [marine sediment metagenome]|uniref:Uncharacterized protein n=1 Tax=marine sediment metagenome TaxID=412755 RepID=A0A0F9J2N9_9ZZZZ